jgi:arginine deiminase
LQLDTVLTKINTRTFGLHPYLDSGLRSWTLTPDADDPAVVPNEGLWDTPAGALGMDKVTVLTASEDVGAAEREQWDDGNNYLTVAPGVMIGCERNVVTNAMLRKTCIRVVTIAAVRGASAAADPSA